MRVDARFADGLVALMAGPDAVPVRHKPTLSASHCAKSLSHYTAATAASLLLSRRSSLDDGHGATYVVEAWTSDQQPQVSVADRNPKLGIC